MAFDDEIAYEEIEMIITNVSPESICGIQMSISNNPDDNGPFNIDEHKSGLEYLDGTMYKIKNMDELLTGQSVTVRINVQGALPLIELDSEQVC